jgi:hypothetical protein
LELMAFLLRWKYRGMESVGGSSLARGLKTDEW